MIKTTNENSENDIKPRFNYFCKSMLLNYKSWFIISLTLFLLDNRITSYITFIIMLLVVYISHYIVHLDIAYPFNIVHLYHHNNIDTLSHIIQILLEFFAFLFILLLKYLLIFQYGVNVMAFVNDWIVVFCYFLYTSIHNINYSIFHVNKIHEIHHKTYMKNIGPDISDIIFGTKMNPDSDLENTDHYIFNVVGSALVVIFLKYFFKKIPILNYGFLTVYFITMIILIYYTITLFEKEMQAYFTESLQKLISV